MRRKPSSAGITRRSKTGGTSMFSKNSSRTTLSITHRNRTTLQTKRACVSLYRYIRAAFPDFHAEIHWQLADGDRVTTHKRYYGTHEGYFLGVAPTHRQIHFETVDVMRVQNGKITDHWGVGNLLSLMEQIGGWTPPAPAQGTIPPRPQPTGSTAQTPTTNPDHNFLISLTPRA